MNLAPEQLVGRTLGGRYRLDRSIGVGGMGVVFQATQLDLGRAVAVKVLLDVDVRSIARLRQEALTAGSLSCPYVVSIFDFQAPPGEPPFVVMELLAGESLAQLLARQRVLSVEQASQIAVEALIGLDFAHRAGVLHRDIKPSNLWLSSGRGMEGHVKVLDFGIAKRLGDPSGVETTTGSLMGTPAYLSPEQLRGQEASERSDQHAIGIVLFEMLVGARPWQSQGVALYAEVLERVPPAVSELVSHVPVELGAIIARALAKDPGARFASVDELRLQLAPFARRESSRSLPPAASSAPAMVHPSLPPTVSRPPSIHSMPMQALMTAHAYPPPAAPRSSSGAGWIVALLAVLILVPGAAFAVYVAMRGTTPGATAPVSGTAGVVDGSVAATPVLAASGAPAASGALGAVPSGGARGGKVGGAPQASSAAGAAGAKTRPRCECLHRMGGELCQRAMTPRCSCEGDGSLCSVPRDATGSCPGGTSGSFVGASLTTGGTCTGFNHLASGKSIQGPGKLTCDVCYGHTKMPAVNGAACAGIEQQAAGKTRVNTDGLWVCDP